jgi:MFS family permease
LLLSITLVMVASAVPIPIEVVFVRHTLHAGASGYGLLLGSWGVGMVAGGAGFIAGSRVRLSRLLVLGALLNAVGYGGIAASETLVLACVFSAVGGVGNGAAWVAAVTAVQELTPLRTQSAVMSVLEGLNQVMPALGFAAGGLLTAITSPRVSYDVAAAAITLVVGVAWLLWSGSAPTSQRDTEAAKAAGHGEGRQEPGEEDRNLATPTTATG